MGGLLQYIRDSLYGGIEKGEYKKRKGAIKGAYADENKIMGLGTRVQGETERNLDQSGYDNPPLVYDYPQGWENPTGTEEQGFLAGVGVTGRGDRKHDFSQNIRLTSPSSSTRQRTVTTNNKDRDHLFRTNTLTPQGTMIRSHLGLAGEDPQLYHKYPEGFGGLPAHEGSYTERRFGLGPLSFGYQTADAPQGMSLIDLLKKRF